MSVNQTILFEFDFCAYFLELSLESFSVGLGKTFLDSAGSTVYHFLSFLEAKTGYFLNGFNNFQFLSTGSLYAEKRQGISGRKYTRRNGAVCPRAVQHGAEAKQPPARTG